MSNSTLLERYMVDQNRAVLILDDAVMGCDDGELFCESRTSEVLVFDHGRLKVANFNRSAGFGLRTVMEDASAYAHSSDISIEAIARAADTVKAVRNGYNGKIADHPRTSNRHLYPDLDPTGSPDFAEKIEILKEIDAYIRSKGGQVKQVSAQLAASHQEVEIIRAQGHIVRDVRPMVAVRISVVVERDGRMEQGYYAMSRRDAFGPWLTPDNWQFAANEAFRIAMVNLEAKPAPAGERVVVLGPGGTGVMLHEAVGHGLEGDFIRKKTSAFADRVGEMVAAPNVTVVDDGTTPGFRGSLTVDDEGTPSGHNVLIENGKLVGYMHDRQSARILNVEPTGNGRRESYEHMPMVRMTNTYMQAGQDDPAEIIESVDDGIYAVNFSGGQVDITSGDFVFECMEAYRIEKGKVTTPIRGAMLIGNGPKAMKKISMVGNDLKIDPGSGTCGKDGQWVPVNDGLPTVRMDGITVGGTEVGA